MSAPSLEDLDRESINQVSDLDLVGLLEALTGHACFVVDTEQNIQAFGPRAEVLTGFAASEVRGRHCLSAIRCTSCLSGCGVYDQGSVAPLPLQLHQADGNILQIRKSGLVLRDTAGEPRRAVELMWEEEGAQPAQGSPLDNFMTAMGRWFVAADAELRLLHCSADLPAFLGYRAEALQGMPLADLLGTELFGQEAPLRRALAEGRRREGFAGALRAADGRHIHVSVSAAPRPQAEGSADGCHAQVAMLVMIRPQASWEGQPGASDQTPGFCGIVGRSAPMQRIFRLVDQIRDNDATVLITGESGTGKELLARAIHTRSQRSEGPFVVINCGALPENLLESELFGHVRGAFTGAIRDKTGRIELAKGGTLLLDEVGDLPLPLQVKLLRLLQTHSFERVGDPHTRTVDVRIIAATHVDLEAGVADRSFRDDLYYRLRVVPIELPPLRQRPGDLELLVRWVMQRIGRNRGRALALSPKAMRALLSHAWPGNVRELENALEYANAVCEGQTIHLDDLPPGLAETSSRWTRARAASPAPGRPARQELDTEQDAEAQRIQGALEATRFHRGRAAERLGMSRSTLWRKMRELRLD